MSAMMIKQAARRLVPIGITAMLLALSACGKIGNPLEVITGDIPPPDEFQVLKHKPLIMPATAELPLPRPGAASPLDPNPHLDARQALLGSGGSIVVNTAAPGAGEQVLLKSANAAAASDDIRVQLEEDKIANNPNAPYEPPSLAELLGFGGGSEDLDESTLLDPAAEANRLQTQGTLTPVDPNAVANVESDRPPAPKPGYPTGRPQSPITGKGTVPTF
jgi:hypothetical protein